MIKYIICSKLIAPSLKVKVDNNEFTCYDSADDTLIIGTDFNNSNDCGFRRHIQTEHCFKDVYSYSIGLWTILHEIGHKNTIDDAEDDLISRAICALISREEAENDENLQNLYFNIPNEWVATEWAINWICEHRKLAKILSYMI